MHQFNKIRSVIYHLYPGLAITLAYVLAVPVFRKWHYPPQMALLLCILLVAVPLLLVHLYVAGTRERRKGIFAINGYNNRLPAARLILYALGLVVLMLLVWMITQPLDKWLTERLLGWLPQWYTTQHFNGYSKDVIRLTLLVNLVLNGLLGPLVEELYFRGYLLPRMQVWGKWAFVVNAVLFSLYHFWQPYVYVTLMLSLLPMTYLVWRTKDLRLAILTHCLLNVTGALLSFGLILK